MQDVLYDECVSDQVKEYEALLEKIAGSTDEDHLKKNLEELEAFVETSEIMKGYGVDSGPLQKRLAELRTIRDIYDQLREARKGERRFKILSVILTLVSVGLGLLSVF